MAVGKPLQLRLFLEGEEVPVIAAQVTINVNAPAAASIQVIPLDESMALKPRTMVHLFFLDSFDVRSSVTLADTRKEDDRLNIPFLDNYKLLFSGETIGFQFVKTPNSRAVVLQCLDFSSYWDAAHATAIEYGPNGNAFTHTGALYGSNTGLFDDIVNTTSDQLVRWIHQTPLSPGLTNISGLAGGVIRVLEMMGGVPQHHRGVNDFFTVAELRCRILAQIAAEEHDDTAANLLRVSVFDEWIRNGLQNIGQQISFRDMLKLLFSHIHYDVVPNPAAKFDPTIIGTTNQVVVTQKLFDHPEAKTALANLNGTITGLSENVAQTDLPTLASAVENYKRQIQSVDSNLALLQTSNKPLTADIKKTRSFLLQAINKLNANANPSNSNFIADVVNSLNQAISAINNSKPVTGSVTKTTTGIMQRLKAQIVRPDCYFAPPPRCNVIFPEQYTQLTYDRLYLSEATRSLVLGYNTLVGQDALLANRFLAPSIGSGSNLLVTNPGKQGYRALMKHELHTGIIPRSEWLPNTQAFSSKKADPNSKNNYTQDRYNWAEKIALFHFFKYRFGPRQASVGGRFNPYLVCGFPALIITRPFIVPTSSQPEATDSAVVEYILGQSQSSTVGNKQFVAAPSQIIGMIIGMVHSLDQTGGTTSVSLDHVRQHLGIDDEFLSVLTSSTVTQTQRIRVKLSATDVATSSKPSLKDILRNVTPQTSPTSPAAISKKSLSTKTVQTTQSSIDPAVGKVIDTFLASFEVSNEASAIPPSSVPPLTSLGRINKIDRDLLVPFPAAKLGPGGKGVFGKIIGVEVTDANIVKVTGGQSYSEVIIYEEVTTPVTTPVPIEEVLRPKWFSDSYSNTYIGQKIYQPFFGVSSIIDEAAFDGLGQTVSSTPPSSGTEGDVQDPEQPITDVVKALSTASNNTAKVSIERSVNFISYIYGLVKARGLDVDDFIKQYSSRPIATLPEMLGDPDLDLTINSDGSASVVQTTGPDGTPRTPRIGFHSLAVHPKVVDPGNLTGLLIEPDLQVQRINSTGKAGPVPPEYDVRKEKKDRVRSYIAALSLGPGFRG